VEWDAPCREHCEHGADGDGRARAGGARYEGLEALLRIGACHIRRRRRRRDRSHALLSTAHPPGSVGHGVQSDLADDSEGNHLTRHPRDVALRARAREVLEANRRGAWTCPSATLYPHQWLWDSCFIAMGLASSDPWRAAGELRSLFRGQWANGMLPHMIFAEGVHDAGSRRIWQSKRNPLAPRDVETSCITQPPLVAV